MKQLLILFVCTLFFVNAKCQTENIVAAQNDKSLLSSVEDVLVLKEPEFDFGKIPQGKPVTHIFEIVNNSKDSLKIGNVQASCGCSGLSYKMDFDNEVKPMDQVFEDKGVKIVTDLKSFLYLVNTELEFSDGLNGKGFYFDNPNASRSCGCGESFAV